MESAAAAAAAVVMVVVPHVMMDLSKAFNHQQKKVVPQLPLWFKSLMSWHGLQVN